MEWLENIGKFVIARLSQCGEATMLLLQTIGQLGQMKWRLMIYQMAHLGVDSLPIIALTLGFAGAVMTLQIASILVKYGAQGTVGAIISIAMGRELGPVLVGVVLAGRVGAAITAELGAMKVTEQIDALRVMAVNPIAYLVAPRFMACIIMVPVLAFFGVIIGVVGGYFIATFVNGLPGSIYVRSIETMVVTSDLTYGLIKASVFGAIIALVGSYKGMHTKMGAEGVGNATTSSVVTSIILIFVINYFLSALLF